MVDTSKPVVSVERKSKPKDSEFKANWSSVEAGTGVLGRTEYRGFANGVSRGTGCLNQESNACVTFMPAFSRLLLNYCGVKSLVVLA